MLPSISAETIDARIHVCENLADSQKVDLHLLSEEFSDVFSSLPGCADSIVHKIELTNNEAARAKAYPTPIHLRPAFDHEVDQLLKLGITQLPPSPYRSPTLMVEKTDQYHRLILDTRALNNLSVLMLSRLVA